MSSRKRTLPPDPGAERALRILDEIDRTVRLETRPVVLSEEYLRAVKQVGVWGANYHAHSRHRPDPGHGRL
jgi:hypothetical protein